MTRYLSGLFACSLGLCTGGWLIVAAALLRGAPSTASLVSLGTGAGVALVSAIGVACWSVAWRQRLRMDGVLADRGGPPSARQARRNRRALRRDMRRVARVDRADWQPAGNPGSPAAALTELRAILEPLLTTGTLDAMPGGRPRTGPGPVTPAPRFPPRPAEDDEESW